MLTPPTPMPLPGSLFSFSTNATRSPLTISAFQSATLVSVRDTTYFFSSPIRCTNGFIHGGSVGSGVRQYSISWYVTRPNRSVSTVSK
jgi:hypothetical protein